MALPIISAEARMRERHSAKIGLVGQPGVGKTTQLRHLPPESTLFVDIREPQEWAREGILPGAYRAPRGMLEFWVDPASPYYRPALDDGRRLVLYCGSAWRSALAAAALRQMGRDDVTHVAGGFAAWRAAGYPIEPYPCES